MMIRGNEDATVPGVEVAIDTVEGGGYNNFILA
jgi:hypothetical protein